MKDKSYGKSGMGKQSAVIKPGTGGGSRPSSVKSGKMATPVSNETSDLEKTRKGSVKALS
jgi:hypothetical protein